MGIETDNVVLLVGPLVMIAVGVMLFVLSSRRDRPRAASRRRLSWLLVGAGAAILLLVMTHSRSGPPQLEVLRSLKASDVAAITVADHPITDEAVQADIVEALGKTRSYRPRPQGMADDVTLRITTKGGAEIAVGAAESFGDAGVVLTFYVDEPDGSRMPVGYAFNETLSERLRRVGIVLPSIRLRQQIDKLRANEVSIIQVGDKAVKNADNVAAIIQSLKDARTQYGRDARHFQEPVEITVFLLSGEAMRLQAARLVSGQGAAFWALCQSPTGVELPHGHLMSHTLSDVLESAGAPLPSRTE